MNTNKIQVIAIWRGTHTHDWPAWAAYHRDLAAYERGRGNAVLAEKHEAIAQKNDRRAIRDAKRRARVAAATAKGDPR